jgi:hypothetical protein
MLYLGTSSNVEEVRALLDRRRIGLMCAYTGGSLPRAGWFWAADNACFTDSWDADAWARWLVDERLPRSGCLFATAPDVVGDAEATLERFVAHLPTVLASRFPVAFVAQDGVHRGLVPWDHFDCLFIGGSDDFKLSEEAFALAAVAREQRKWVHVGRVNGGKRYRAWASWADSCDGTFLAFGPSQNTHRLVRWLDRHDREPQLWELTP